MSTSERSSYHHGSLKAALLDAADTMLDEADAGAISLREVARRAGVSPTATYRHFADKEALLAALATRAFEAFGTALMDAAAQANDPLAAMGQAYVRFALARPGRFRLMFGPLIGDRSRYPELKQAAGAAFDHMRRLAQVRFAPQADEAAALRSWAMVHGLAHLLLDGMLPLAEAETLARAITTLPPQTQI
jgi:AcrR family transcriptional regulator